MKKKNLIILLISMLAIISGVVCLVVNKNTTQGKSEQTYYESYRKNILGIAGDFCVFTYSDASVSEVTADVAIGGNFSGKSFGNYTTNWDFYKKNNLKFVNLNSYVRGEFKNGIYTWKAEKSKAELTDTNGLIKGTYELGNANGKANLYLYTGNGKNTVGTANINQVSINGTAYENIYQTDASGVSYNAYNVNEVDYDFIDFEKEFENLGNISKKLINYDNQIKVSCNTGTASKTYTYKIPENKDTVLINVDSANFFNETICDTFNIDGLNSNKKIVINVDCNGYLGKQSPKIQVNGSADDWNALAENIVFNYYLDQFADETIEAKEVIGTVLAPNMNIFINGNLDGAVLARKVTANNAIYGINSNIAWGDLETTPVEKVTVSGTKTWVDNNDEYGSRPTSIELTLYKKGSTEDIKVTGIQNPITVNSVQGNSWAYSFDEVDKYDENGNEIEYIVKENEITGYTTVINKYQITNTIIEKENPELIDVTVTKIWNDAGYESLRPKSVKINLLANGKIIKTQEITESDNWKYTFPGLNKNDESKNNIVYTITEEKIDGYITEINGLKITNTYIKPAEITGDLTIDVEKYQTNTEIKLEDAEFNISLKDESNNEILSDIKKTDSNGQILLESSNIPVGSYVLTLSEKKAPSGYTISTSNLEIKFKVEEKENAKVIELLDTYKNVNVNNMKITAKIENSKIETIPEIPENNTVEKVNEVVQKNETATIKLPQTGSNKLAIGLIVIGGLMIVGLIGKYKYTNLKK